MASEGRNVPPNLKVTFGRRDEERHVQGSIRDQSSGHSTGLNRLSGKGLRRGNGSQFLPARQSFSSKKMMAQPS
jgi:hypothetical protein